MSSLSTATGLARLLSPAHFDFKANAESPEQIKQHIHNVLDQFLTKCGLSLNAPEYDLELHNACWEEAVLRGCDINGEKTKRGLARFIPMGVIIACHSYRHLPHQSTKVFIALYTALLIYVDDMFQYNVEDIKQFNERFVRRQPQGDPNLDALAGLFMEFEKHFDPFASKIMLTSSLDFMTAQLLEYAMEEMKLSSQAGAFATYARGLSGVAAFYGLAIWPRELPVQGYIQALPEAIFYCNHTNDVFSFYKEEIAGEQVNHVSNMANMKRISKPEALQLLAEETSDACLRGLDILKDHPNAHAAFKAFTQGYIDFHACCSRYKLDDLFDYQIPPINV